jgi:hypothetical protein
MKKLEIIKTIDDCELCPYFNWNEISHSHPGDCSQLGRSLKIKRPEDTFEIPLDCPLAEA